jgi:hypothetical protein
MLKNLYRIVHGDPGSRLFNSTRVTGKLVMVIAIEAKVIDKNLLQCKWFTVYM